MQSNTAPVVNAAAFAAPASPLFVRVVDVDQRPHTINLSHVVDLRCWPDKYFHGAIELATGNVVDLNRDNYALVSNAVHGLTFNPAGKPGPLPLREPFRDLHPEQSQDYLDAQGKLFGAARDHRLDPLDRDGRLAFASEVFDENIWSFRCLTPDMMHVLRMIINDGHVQPGWAWDGICGDDAEALLNQ